MGNGTGSLHSAPRQCKSTSENATTHTFHAISLRAPIFAKHQHERVDPKANNKYCNEGIARKWFETMDTDAKGEVTFENYRNSSLGKELSESEARSIFNQMDCDGNQAVDFQEFKKYYAKSGLPAIKKNEFSDDALDIKA
jgi:hypothetical protein